MKVHEGELRRVIEQQERAGTPEGEAFLRAWAGDDELGVVAEEAKAALARLAKKAGR